MDEVIVDDNQMPTVGIPDDNHCRPQVRLGKGRIGKAKKEPVSDERFDLFWKAYPRHVAKQNAVRAFSKLNPNDDLFQTILKDIEARKKTNAWSKEGGQFIPHPATYLNGRRWEDEMPKPSPPVNAGRKAPKIDWGDDD